MFQRRDSIPPLNKRTQELNFSILSLTDRIAIALIGPDLFVTSQH